MMGPALTSFQGMVLFAYVDPLIVMLIVQFAIYLATEPAGEVESNRRRSRAGAPAAATRHREPLVPRDGDRHPAHERRDAGHDVGRAVVDGAAADAQWPAARTVFSLSAHMTLIAWCFGCIALAASGWARRRGAVDRRGRRRRDRGLPRGAARVDLGAGARASPASRRSTTTRATGILAGTAPEVAESRGARHDRRSPHGPRLLEVSTAGPVKPARSKVKRQRAKVRYAGGRACTMRPDMEPS